MALFATPLSVAINPTVSLLDKCKTLSELRQIHSQMIKTGLNCHTFTVSRLIAVCSLSGLSGGLHYAFMVFNQIKEPNPFTFFAMIKGFADSEKPELSIVLYYRMLHCLEYLEGIEFSIPSVLKACCKIHAFEEGRQVHAQISKTQFQHDSFVSNSMVRMYLQFGKTEHARRMFDKMPQRDLISWNSMIAGHFKAGEIASACELFEKMPQKDLVSWNSMIDGYAKLGKCELAREIFERISDRDVVSWTAMICGYIINDRPIEALQLFRSMLGSSIKPDIAAIVNVLSAIADLGFVEEGKWVHAYVTKNKIRLSHGVLGSALIDMYSKCGYIHSAFQVFRKIMHRRIIGHWNSMISGLAFHGLGQKALEVFEEMEKMEIDPDEITFLGVLSACNHGGLIKDGCLFFELMCEKYDMVPKIQHYGCMIDLLGRAGHVKEALKVIREMPMEPDVMVWKAMLSACLKHDHVVTGEIAAKIVMELEPHDSSCYVLLSNIYAKAKKWDDVALIRSVMKERGVRKVPGCSRVAINGEIHEFLLGKEMKSKRRERVLCKLGEMICRLKLEGYEPDSSQVIVDVDEEEKESLLSLHSEKMAIAFGLIHMNQGVPIHVVNNLRVCCDCHSFSKLVSKVYNQEIVLRDQNRFHHFSNGSCSCNDYW